MKKVLNVLFVLLVIILLAGCQEIVPTEEIIYENPIIFEAYDLENNLIVKQTIEFPTDSENTVFEVIAEAVDMDYTMSEYGAFINAIEGHYPKEFGITYNYMFSLYVNDEIAPVGISSITYSEGLKITFKEEFTSWLDQTDYLVDQIIYSFIEDQITNYINDESIDHQVLSALYLLNSKGYPVIDFNELITDKTTINFIDPVKSSFIKTIFDIDATDTKTALESMTRTNPYNAANLLSALSVLNGNTEIISELISNVATTFEFIDPDYVGMAMLALAKHQSNPLVIDIMPEFMDVILDSLSVEGVMSWGNANASSTATVIIGLLAHGYQPRAEMFQTDGVDLIEALIEYYSEGVFKWQLNSDLLDTSFSTPQAFAALVVYKISRDIWGNPPVDLFDLN